MVIAKDLAFCMRPVLKFLSTFRRVISSRKWQIYLNEYSFIAKAGRKLSKEKFRQITKDLLDKTENNPSYSITVAFYMKISEEYTDNDGIDINTMFSHKIMVQFLKMKIQNNLFNNQHMVQFLKMNMIFKFPQQN